MATRGIFQLQKLVLRYCEHGGSSRAMREFIEGHVVEWATSHPNTKVEVRLKPNRHPIVEGHYKTQVVSHQVCVKNVDSYKDVREVCDMMANRSGRKITKLDTPILTDTPSVQGIWTPFLNLQHEEPFQVSFVQSHPIEQGTVHVPPLAGSSSSVALSEQTTEQQQQQQQQHSNQQS